MKKMFVPNAIITMLLAVPCLWASGIPSVAVSPETLLPQPVVGWNCALPSDVRIGDAINYDTETFTGFGSDQSLTTLRLLPGANTTRIQWATGPTGRSAVSLCATNASPENGGVLQCGSGAGVFKTGNRLTLAISFKLLGDLSYGGDNPPYELDGELIHLPPTVSLFISGRGANGKGKHLLKLRINSCIYSAKMEAEFQTDHWYRVVVTWNGQTTAGQTESIRARMWVNGIESSVGCSSAPNNQPERYAVQGPILIGGDRSWSNAPIVLGGFALSDQALSEQQVKAIAIEWAGTASMQQPTANRPAYQVLRPLNLAQNWKLPEAPLNLESLDGTMLKVSFSNPPASGKRVCYLQQPISLDTQVASVNCWVCSPASPQEVAYFSVLPVFADKNGKEIDGPAQTFVSTHVCPPNSRKAGLWCFFSAEVPRREGATQLVGYAMRFEGLGGSHATAPLAVYLKDFALERTDYTKVHLYYVVGNYRDNFSMTAFNGSCARALTEQSSGAETPYVLLDNLIDQAKSGRPARVNLLLAAYDVQDRLVYTSRLANLPAKDVSDFFTPIPIPLTTPGTYRIQGKSYDAETGEYFTTDWVKLIVIKGNTALTKPREDLSQLAINPSKPFGRLEKTDKREITFRVNCPAPCEIRYAVIANSAWVPVWTPRRVVTLATVVPVSKSGVITVPYTPRHTVELVVAELWLNNRCMDREERLIGLRNELDVTPPYTNRAKILSLNDLAGPGKNFLDVQLNSQEGENLLDVLAKNIDELKKVSPNIGLYLDLNKLMPMPGVYDWDNLTPIFDLAEQHGCRIFPYLAEKWPTDWAPVEFQIDSQGCAHRGTRIWGYMMGNYLYPNGEFAPNIIRNFNMQFARRYLNNIGLGGYYFENEHVASRGMNPPIESYHAAYQKAFAAFLSARYPSIAKLNAVYEAHYRSFAAVPLPVPGPDAQKTHLADFAVFQELSVENFVRKDQVDPVRQIDPQRPIIVYALSGAETYDFLQHLVDSGAMMANGGVHSDFNVDSYYERYNAVPKLNWRMEPHDQSNFDPVLHGYDEMVFGMLGMGGRGLHHQFFLQAPQYQNFKFAEAVRPGQVHGYDKLITYAPLVQELRDAEKQHDPIGIMSLGSPQTYFGAQFEWGSWNVDCAVYALWHYSPRVVGMGGRLAYLDGSKVIFLGGSIIDAAQIAYLQRYLRQGGKVVMEDSDGRYGLENVHGTHALLDTLGVDFFADGAQVPGLAMPHDLYTVDKGQLLIIRRRLWSDKWAGILPAIMSWAGVTERLANSGDQFMQIHVLENQGVYYLATTHRGYNQSATNGPRNWDGKVQFCTPLPAGEYRVTELMQNQPVGVFTPAQLAVGFNAGNYEELQMKIFKIERVK